MGGSRIVPGYPTLVKELDRVSRITDPRPQASD